MILDATRDCAAMITVCAALKDAIVGLGGTANKITVLRNGVDLQLFQPEYRQRARQTYGMVKRFFTSDDHGGILARTEGKTERLLDRLDSATIEKLH